MFEFVRTHKRLMQTLLLLLVFPSFVFFGVQGYSRFMDGSMSSVASVDGHAITAVELDNAHRQQVERLRAQMPNLDAKFFDSPDFKRETLEGLVRERVIQTAADAQHLSTPDTRLQRIFQSDPEYAFLRKPDGSLNKDVLMAQGMSAEQFVQRFRRELTMRQVMQGLSESATGSDAATRAALDALFQQREVQVQTFNTADFASKVTPTDAQIEAYYNDAANQSLFMAPESASVEYAVLDLDAVKKTIAVSDEDLRKYYDENAARFGTPEERRARHILVNAPAGASADDKAKARARAESLLEQVKRNPASFADVARKNSDDTGSAEKGGELEWFGRGAMVKPFEDAAFTLKPGEISGLVETEFGFHVIQVEGARGGEKKTFEAVRQQVADEVRKDLAQKKYAESAEQFTNTVYEQSDSLKPVADKFKLELKTAPASRTPGPDASGPLANAKFLEALFNADNIRAKRNTEAVEVAPNQLVSGRVVSYEPAHRKALAEVKDAIRQRLVTQGAADLARAAGQARLSALKGGATDAMPAAETMSRAKPGSANQALLDAVLAADAAQLPAYVGVSLGDAGYAVARIVKVLGRDPAFNDEARARQQYAQAWSAAEAMIYYDALKKRFNTEIKPLAPAPAATN